MKVWEKRFSELPDDSILEFTSSLKDDFFLYPYDIKGSQAHVEMLCRGGYISPEEKKILIEGLEKIKKELDQGTFPFQKDEDIHMAIERRLQELVGEVADKLHTARSRNDQVVLDEKMFLKEKIKVIIEKIKSFQEIILGKAEENIEVIMPGFTHFRPAQPVLFSHWLMAYFWMMERDKERFKDVLKRNDVLPLGSGALSGTSLNIDREFLAKKLAFSRVSPNSMDAVSERDFIVEFVFSSSLLFLHLSRLSEELIIYSSPFFAWITIPDKYCTGSSIMPQKKNPDILELIRGKASKILGYATAISSLIKSLPLTYNRDLQEDKDVLRETPREVISTLEIIQRIVKEMEIHPANMQKDATTSYVLATDLVELMVEKGTPFRQAYRKVGEIVKILEKQGKDFSSLSQEEWNKYFPFPKEEMKDFEVKISVERKKSSGGTAPSRVKEQIARGRELLAK
ncbi:MAG: argininosuccinate lyase [Caldiserica bacterium]|nr:argininosuccinate lyase [Caldisericota bacterium]